MIKEPFTPIRFYEDIIPNHEECKSEYHKIVDKLKADGIMIKESGGPVGEDDSLLTDYFKFKEESNIDAMKLWHPFCMKYLQSAIVDFMDNFEIKDLAFTGIWSQISKGLQFHHPHAHAHGGLNWSFCWYIDVDPSEHKSTVWYPPPPSDEMYQTELVPNKLVIWPSWVLHYQPPSNSNVDRCVISGNISEEGLD